MIDIVRSIRSTCSVYWDGTINGTLFTPNGNVTINNTTAYGMHGAIYCGGFLDVYHPNAPITYIRANPLVLPSEWLSKI